MNIFTAISDAFLKGVAFVYGLLWGDLFTISLPGGNQLGVSLLVLLLIPAGVFFTIRTKVLPIRLFPEMLRISTEKSAGKEKGAISGMQALIVSTATRVGMGNLVGVVAAVSFGGAGAVFWMWITALIGASTAFVEATLAQLHKQKDPLYAATEAARPITSRTSLARAKSARTLSPSSLPCPAFFAGAA